jgi:uncharacterized protein YceK
VEPYASYDDQRWPNQIYSGTRAAAGGHATQLDIPFSFMADTLLLPAHW